MMDLHYKTTEIRKYVCNSCVKGLSLLVILMAIGLSNNSIHAEPTSEKTEAVSAEINFAYQEIKAIYKKLNNENDPEDLAVLVNKANNFVTMFPKYKRVDEVYYYLGNGYIRMELVKEGIKAFEKLIKDHPDARYVQPSLLELGLAFDKLSKHDKADEIYNKLIEHPKFGSKSYAKQAKQILILERSERNGKLATPDGVSAGPNSNLIGKPAPDFKVKDLKGKELSLEKYRGKVILLDFWATWCGPCIAELPNVKRTYEKHKDQKFEIIGISLDSSKTKLDTFIKKEGLNWIHYWDHNQSIAQQYKVSDIPSMFLIDGKGVVRKANLSGDALGTEVAKLVKENITKPAISESKLPTKGTQMKSVPALKIQKKETTTQNPISMQQLREKMQAWVGKKVPDLEVKDISGNKLSMKDYRGQVVLLDFWATWCGPCIAEMPKLKKTFQEHKDQKFQIIGISLDKTKQPLEDYIKKEELGWVHYWDEDRKVRTEFGVKGIPTAFLIDGEGTIRTASIGGFDVETAVAELVKENLAKQPNSTETEKQEITSENEQEEKTE